MYTVGVRLDDPVARIMSVPVYTVHVDQPTSAVRRMMREHRFHHVPVVSEGVLVSGLAVVRLEGECSRCLIPLAEDLDVDIQEPIGTRDQK